MQEKDIVTSDNSGQIMSDEQEKRQDIIDEKSSGEELSDGQTENTSQTKVIEIAAGNTVFGYFLGAMIIFGVCFVCSIFLFQIIFTPINVVGNSMLPTINAAAKGNEYDIYTDTVYYTKTSHYNNLDIVIINAGKTTRNKPIIKRVVAVPGQKITFKFLNYFFDEYGQKMMTVEYYVDDVLMNDNYVLESQMNINTRPETSSLYQFHNDLIEALQNNISTESQVAHEYSLMLGENEYFVMGDNRNVSVDSRMFGTVKYEEIAGVVLIHVKHGQTLIHAIWQAIFGNCLIFNAPMIKI